MAHSAEEHSGEDIHLPKPSYWPMLLGIGGGLMMLGFIAGTSGTFGKAGRDLTRALGMGDWAFALPGLLVLLVALSGWLISNIRERAHTATFENAPEMAKFAMWCFIGTECILFGGLMANAIVVWSRAPEVHAILHPLSSLLIVSLNTFLLLASSLGVVMALSAIQRDDRKSYGLWMGATALLGLAFLSIQGYEYSKLVSEGFKLVGAEAPYESFAPAFFFLTGFHGLHVAGGVLWALMVLIHGLRGGFTAHAHMGVEIFGLYWHFVDVVWILIFTLIYLI